MQRRYILSIDGGGVRGIIPALALMKLERTTNRPARETFSFVAGTSTGALLASAVGGGPPAPPPGHK
jgi:patatin-like phospholipase/acyl hydrolase